MTSYITGTVNYAIDTAKWAMGMQTKVSKVEEKVTAAAGKALKEMKEEVAPQARTWTRYLAEHHLTPWVVAIIGTMVVTTLAPHLPTDGLDFSKLAENLKIEKGTMVTAAACVAAGVTGAAVEHKYGVFNSGVAVTEAVVSEASAIASDGIGMVSNATGYVANQFSSLTKAEQKK
jgi:hypothetical protein